MSHATSSMHVQYPACMHMQCQHYQKLGKAFQTTPARTSNTSTCNYLGIKVFYSCGKNRDAIYLHQLREIIISNKYWIHHTLSNNCDRTKRLEHGIMLIIQVEVKPHDWRILCTSPQHVLFAYTMLLHSSKFANSTHFTNIDNLPCPFGTYRVPSGIFAAVSAPPSLCRSFTFST